jgi:hypothetical protein
VGTQDSAFLQQVLLCRLHLTDYIIIYKCCPLTFPLFADYTLVLILQASYITGGVYMKPQELSGLFQYLAVSYYFYSCVLSF